MPQWSWELKPTAEENLAAFELIKRRQVIDKLDWLAGNFESVTPAPLKGEFRDFFKLRIGDVRALYKINWKNNKIIVFYIAKRDRAYKTKGH